MHPITSKFDQNRKDWWTDKKNWMQFRCIGKWNLNVSNYIKVGSKYHQMVDQQIKARSSDQS